MINQMAPLRNFVEINPESVTKTYPYDEILYIDISSVGSGYFAESPKLLSINEAPSRAKRIVRDEDTILATVRPNLRSFMFIKEPDDNTVASTGFAVLRAKDNVVPRFIYYAVTDRRFTGYLTNNTKGTSYPAVDTATVLRGEIPDFNLRQQRVIASILSAYDDLIENNRRRIQLLEQAARLLYKEWFVHLRFPGYERAKIIDGVPEGWERKTLGEIVDVTRGKNITKNSANTNGSVPVVAGGLSPAYYHDTANVLGPVITISASGANAGYVNLYHEDIWASDCSYISRKSTEHLYYLFELMKSKQKEIFGFQKGAAQPHVYPKDLQRLPLLVPKGTMVSMFEESVSHNFHQIRVLLEQNKLLAKARDLLLPRLMNGEVAV